MKIMKVFLSLFFLFLSSNLFSAEGDSYACIIKNINKNTPSGISDTGIEINTLFELDWKKDTIVIDSVSIYDIIAKRDENVFATQDLEIDFKPYAIPFSTLYLVDGHFSLSLHSPDENHFTLSVFADCNVN